jgi:hypothetical protein
MSPDYSFLQHGQSDLDLIKAVISAGEELNPHQAFKLLKW